MIEVISIKFKGKGKAYFFDPNGLTVNVGDHVIVETSKGPEYAECVRSNHEENDSDIILPLRPVLRIATKEDDARAEMNRRKEKEAFGICREKIVEHGLDMKLVDVEYSFDGSKILFFFTSDGRVDFRELVKDLASVFRTRIELRQIGVRDEARMLGGLGICGKPFCCAQFLDDFQPVSIKMAKTQGLSLNPTKISGTCGRLMCCLKYEQDAYEDLVKNVPKVDSFVDTPAGKGLVIDVNLLRGTVRVKLDDSAENAVKTFSAGEIEVLGGKAKRAEYLAAKAEGLIEEKPREERRLEKPTRRPKAPEPVEASAEVPTSTVDEPAEKPDQPKKKRRHRSKPHKKDGEKQESAQKKDSAPKQKPAAEKHPGEKQGDKPAEKHGDGKSQHKNRNHRRRRPKKPNTGGNGNPPAAQ